MAGTLEQRYALRDKIAAGAAGTVWRALDRVTGEVVAIKILHQEVVRERDVVAAFREEGAVLAELDHPGVVRPREFIAADGELALVMDLVEGTDLRRLVATGGPLAPATAAAVL
ncbi:MAG: protein kinase, partial [Actinocatenispora sp.]